MAHGIIGSHHHSIVASRVAMVAHVLFLTTAVLMLVWLLHFRGGINIQSEDPEQIFNVRCGFFSSCSPLLICSALHVSRRSFPNRSDARFLQENFHYWHVCGG
jgi:cytochrome b-561